ncbi:MAG TPA: hypothetical protein VGQ71_02035 [Terriglobales bacterium]|jgi:hypothetical protein|nr:hypothetical protein [Terriglobales bacterium]
MRAVTKSALVIAALLALSAIALPQQPPGEKPIWVDHDMKSIPEPKEHETGFGYDFINGTVFQQIKQAFDFPRTARIIAGKRKEAYNVNSVGGVPDSSWFTNRNGRRPMSLEEIRRGPDEDAGPSGSVLTITRGKTQGFTPGFWIKDSRGDTYIIKFDPPRYLELASAAEVIATKLFYAIGYSVPQNTIFYLRPEQLQIAPDAKFTDKSGVKRRMTQADLEAILGMVARRADGSYRAVASKLLQGTKGGFHFLGVRRDDPNDIIPHEHRRDLRALRVFCAWLEHNDIRAANTLDRYVSENGRSFIRHYLIDFGSALGSETFFPNPPRVGHSHIVDWEDAGKVLLTAGIYQPSWTYGKKFRYPSVGLYSAEDFNPQQWKQNFPLVAFENMTQADAAWAAEIVGSFTDEQIRAAVETGQLSDRDAAEYLASQIIARRDKIVQAYLGGRAQRQAAAAERK